MDYIRPCSILPLPSFLPPAVSCGLHVHKPFFHPPSSLPSYQKKEGRSANVAHTVKHLPSSFKHQVDYIKYMNVSPPFLLKTRTLPKITNISPVPLTWLFCTQLCSAHVWSPQMWGRGTHDQPARCATEGGWSQRLHLWLLSSSATH